MSGDGVSADGVSADGVQGVSGLGAAAGAQAAAAPAVPLARERTHLEYEKFWNWPNTITMLRIAVVPTLFLLPFYHGPLASQVFGWLFAVAAISDLLDGWLARRGQQVTRIGKLLDPLADKVLVSTALIMLISIGRLDWWGEWMVALIVGRELAVTGLRGMASADGVIVAATWHGKVKTLTQNVAVICLLLHEPTFGLPARELGLTLLALATALTLWSGWVYFVDYLAADRATVHPDDA